MSRKITWIAAGVVLLAFLILFLVLPRPVTLVVNGQSQDLRVQALNVGSALRQAGLRLNPEDRLDPSASAWLMPGMTILLDQAQRVTILEEPAGETHELHSPQRRPVDLLAEAGVTLGPHDRLTLNGLPVDEEDELAYSGHILLQLHRAVQITISENGDSQTVNSSAATLGQALWEAGLSLGAADRISLPLETPLTGPLEAKITRAEPVRIQAAGQEISLPSSADNVAEVLSEASVSLQGLDYSQPAESAPLPADRTIRVVRVKEEVILQQKPLPFKNVYQPDANTELDRRSIVTPGEFGVQVARQRVRYEDGVEVERTEEDQWTAKEPKDQVIGYGTQPVVNTIDTPYGTLEYWRAVNVYATSYSPCRLGVSNYCNSTTASGLPLRQGIVAVTRAWYSWMVGQRVYIPGYGIAVIADTGGGIPGRYWVDLGYSDDDFVSWHSTVTMYFLTPIPASIPWILP
jgi:uncharacterized protein YabE (DUF348 family)